MKKNIICFLLFFIFGCTALGGCSNGPKEYQKVLSEEEIAQLQKEKYTLCYPGGSFADVGPAAPLEERVLEAPFATLEFVEKLPMIEYNYTPEEGTSESILAEKGGMSQYTFHYSAYKFKIVDRITGEIPDYLVEEDGTITLSLPHDFETSMPNFQKGQQYVIKIAVDEDSKSLKTGWFNTYEVFYVTDNNCVLSTTNDEKRQMYSGYRLNDFEEILQEMERNPSEPVSK